VLRASSPGADTFRVDPQVVPYSERPELWAAYGELFDGVWPEYNKHGAELGYYWTQLEHVFPDWQFMLVDPEDQKILAAGFTVPVAWDGTDADLGPGIEATIAAAFRLQAAGGRPTAVSALAAEIPPRHQSKGLAPVVLKAMATLAAQAGLPHLIAPVRPSQKDRYPTIPRSLHIAGPVADWESWTDMRFPETGDYVFPEGLATVHIDREQNTGEYWEPNMWLIHEVSSPA
jgi:hypothetical protein